MEQIVYQREFKVAMLRTLTIVKRELRSFFVTPTAYFVLSGFLLIGAYFFFNLLASFNLMLARYAALPASKAAAQYNLNQGVIEPFFHAVTVLLIFIVPLITMRLLAEERRQGTLELILSYPLSSAALIWGKFIALSIMLLIMIALVAVFPLLLCVFGEPELWPVISGLAGLSLIALSFGSIGLAASAWFNRQIMAGIMAIVVLLLLYVIHSPGAAMEGGLSDFFTFISPVMHLKDLFKGVISLSTIVYFFSFIALGIFLAFRAVDALRYR